MSEKVSNYQELTAVQRAHMDSPDQTKEILENFLGSSNERTDQADADFMNYLNSRPIDQDSNGRLHDTRDGEDKGKFISKERADEAYRGGETIDSILGKKNFAIGGRSLGDRVPSRAKSGARAGSSSIDATKVTLETHPDLHDPEGGMNDKLIDDWAKAELNGDKQAAKEAQDKIQDIMIEASSKGIISNDEVSAIIERLHDLKEMNKVERAELLIGIKQLVDNSIDAGGSEGLGQSKKPTPAVFETESGQKISTQDELVAEIRRLGREGDIEGLSGAGEVLLANARIAAGLNNDPNLVQTVMDFISNESKKALGQGRAVSQSSEIYDQDTEDEFLNYLKENSLENADGARIRYRLLQEWGLEGDIANLEPEVVYGLIMDDGRWEGFQKRSPMAGVIADISGANNESIIDTSIDEIAVGRFSRLRASFKSLPVRAKIMFDNWNIDRESRGQRGRKPLVIAGLGVIASGAVAAVLVNKYGLPFSGGSSAGQGGESLGDVADMLRGSSGLDTSEQQNSLTDVAQMLRNSGGIESGSESVANLTQSGAGALPSELSFKVEGAWQSNSPTAWSWAEGLGVPKNRVPDFLREIMGDNWEEAARRMQEGDELTATPDQLSRYVG